MRCAVLGGAGYLGSVLVPMLLDLGHEVTVLDAFVHNQNSLAACYHNERLSVHKVDLRKPVAEYYHLVVDADVVIPLHGLVGMPACSKNPMDSYHVNYVSITNLGSRLSSRAEPPLIIYPATNSSYGRSGDKQAIETDPLNPLSRYAQDKVGAEKWLLQHYPKAVTLRFATLFGMSPRMRFDLMVNDFVWRAVKDRAMVLFEPDYKRCFVHVRDAARVIIFMMQLAQPSIYGEAFNIAPINITKRELCENIETHTPFVVHEASYETDPDQRDYFVSMDKFYLTAATHQTRFNFEHSLTGGILELIRGYQALL